MASSQIPEVIDRDYIDNFSIKETVKNTLVPKYFEGEDVSDLTVGLLGYTTELISDGLEDTFNTISVLHKEQFPNRATLPSSILAHGAIFQLSNGMANASTADFMIFVKEDYIIKNFQNENGNNIFYIDKDTKILVEDTIFTLDYDIAIRGIWREVIGGYIYSAQYVMDGFHNSISNVTTPYIRLNKSANGYLSLMVTCHQCQRVVEYNSIINNTKINFPTFDITFDSKLAGFDVYYKSSTDTDYSVQLTKLNKYSAPLKTPFCYYSFTDENVLTIMFSNRESYFQPDFNSEIKVVLYITDGKSGNFDSYKGKDVTVVTTSDRFAYNDNFFVMAMPLGGAVGGTDARTLEELQALTVEGYRTATVYATDNDLMEYFNNYIYRYGNECLFIKKRDDVVDRLYSGFIIMRKNDYIYPTNTLYLVTNLNQFVNSDVNKYTLDPGCLFTYDDNGHAIICYNEEKYAELYPKYEAYLKDNDKTNADYSFWEYAHDAGEELRYTIYDDGIMDKLLEKHKFVYTNPFLISASKTPNLVGMYLTVINQKATLDFTDQNLDVFDQFVINTISINRDLDKERKYSMNLSVLPAATLSTSDDVITVYGDLSKCDQNLIRVVATFEDTDGHELCYTEFVPMEATTSGIYRFTGTIYTDDHVTTTGKFRITDNVTYIAALEDMLVPMSVVMNIYVLSKINNNTNNKFAQYDESFNGYEWTNVYSTDNDPLTFIKPMNMIKSDLVFKDHRLEQNQIGDVQISSIPFVGVDVVNEQEKLDYFVSTFQDQYNNLESTVDYLKTSTHIDIKFYNTYGKSRNFIIGDEVDGEELIDTINITIKYYVWVTANTDILKAEKDIKQYIKEYIESINENGTNNFYNSNMMRSIEQKFAYVHHIKFIGINDYSTVYQTVKNVTIDLDTLTKEERTRYVPEILVANLDNIDLTFFEA